MRRRQAVRGRGRRPTRASALLLVPARHARASPSPRTPSRAGITAPAARSSLQELRGAGGQLAARRARPARRCRDAAARWPQAVNLGIGRAAYEAALDYAQLRVQGGRAIVEHQAIGSKLADVAIRLEVARNAIWQAAWASDHPAAQADRSLPDLPLTADRAGVRLRGDLSRRQGRRRMLRRHGRDARHAAAEIHPRRADLPATPATATPTPSCASPRRSSGHRRAPLLAAE